MDSAYVDNQLRPKANSKTVIVIDYDEDLRFYVKSVLGRHGIKVVMLSGGEQALKVLKWASYPQADLIICDMMMPKYSGLEVIRELQNSNQAHVPILIITAKIMDAEMVQMLLQESNVIEFLNKPFGMEDFRTRVHNLLGTKPGVEENMKADPDVWGHRA